MNGQPSDAEALVFVSSFAAGAEGAIQAFRLNLRTGHLAAAERTTGIENPFFLAVTRDGRFLY